MGRQGQGWRGLSSRALCCLSSAPHHQDGSGYIDENELDALLKDLYEKNKKVNNRVWRPRKVVLGQERGFSGRVEKECGVYFALLITHN